jgi:hypothetical protein
MVIKWSDVFLVTSCQQRMKTDSLGIICLLGIVCLSKSLCFFVSDNDFSLYEHS